MSELGFNFSVHLVGIVIWLGAAMILPLGIFPALGKLDAESRAKFLSAFLKRMLPWVIGSAIAVGITGWLQTNLMIDEMAENPVIILKHIAILLLIVASAATWFFLYRYSKPVPNGKGLWIGLLVSGWAQIACGVAVLALTGLLTQ